MKKVVDLLQTSARPLFLLGAGAREAAPEIVAFCERWQIPMETTWNAIDLVPYAHPLFIGRPGIVATRGSNHAVQECDLLIAIGARLDQPTIAYDYSSFAKNAKKIMVDIDISESLKIPNLDIFYHMDAGEFIRELGRHEYDFPSLQWMVLCERWKRDRLEGTTTTYQLMDMLSDALPSDDIIVINCGCMAVNIFCAGFRNKAGQRYIMSSCGLGSMGAAIPVAIGAAIASGKHVTCIDGDGSFMQNVQELEIVRRLNLPITFYVMDNAGYASIRSSETRSFGRTKSGETIPDITAVAKAFCVDIIRVIVEEEELPIPRVWFDGRGNLGDMYPYHE
jgi:acetolactate synthase-1/2/3 large subunit